MRARRGDRVCTLRDQLIHPSINVDELDPVFEGLNLVTERRSADVRYALKLSAGFGGHNCALALERAQFAWDRGAGRLGERARAAAEPRARPVGAPLISTEPTIDEARRRRRRPKRPGSKEIRAGYCTTFIRPRISSTTIRMTIVSSRAWPRSSSTSPFSMS